MTGPDDTDRDDAAPPDGVLAAEYALHLMDADARRAFEARLNREPALRAELATWEESLVAIAADVPAVEPPRRLKADLEATLFGEAAAPRRSRFGGWFGGVLTAAAIALAVFLAVPEQRFGAPDFLAEVTSDSDGTLLVRAELSETMLSVRLVGVEARPGRSLQMWFLPEGATVPVSLGVLPPTESAVFEVPAELVERFDGGLMAVSDEPEGGSPTGQPTGEVLGHGDVQTL